MEIMRFIKPAIIRMAGTVGIIYSITNPQAGGL
jgi:hypothetical protein